MLYLSRELWIALTMMAISLVALRWINGIYDQKDQQMNASPQVAIFQQADAFHNCNQQIPRLRNAEMIERAIGYPSVAKRSGLEGEIIMKVVVDKNGNYRHHRVVRGYHPVLQIPAEAFVSFLQFEPLICTDGSGESETLIRFHFDLPS